MHRTSGLKASGSVHSFVFNNHSFANGSVCLKDKCCWSSSVVDYVTLSFIRHLKVFSSAFPTVQRRDEQQKDAQLLKRFKVLLMKPKQKKVLRGAACHRLDKRHPSTFRVRYADVWVRVFQHHVAGGAENNLQSSSSQESRGKNINQTVRHTTRSLLRPLD